MRDGAAEPVLGGHDSSGGLSDMMHTEHVSRPLPVSKVDHSDADASVKFARKLYGQHRTLVCQCQSAIEPLRCMPGSGKAAPPSRGVVAVRADRVVGLGFLERTARTPPRCHARR